MNNNGTIDTTDIDLMISEDRFPMAIANGTNADGSTKYRSVLYDFSLSNNGTEVIVSDKSYTPESGYWEPGYLNDSTYADGNPTNNNVGITSTSLQTEFDRMIAKVKTNGGFWVGRYETTSMVKDSSQDSTKKITVIKGTTEGIADTASASDGTGLNWYRMYAQQKNYANLYSQKYNIEATRTSSMIWGSQWDQIMIWMRKIANDKNTANKNTFYVINAVGMGNLGVTADEKDKNSSDIRLAETGSSDDYKVKNIYDLAGNVYDWTLESSKTSNRVLRRK